MLALLTVIKLPSPRKWKLKLVLVFSVDIIRIWLKFAKIWLTIWPILPENLTKIWPFLTIFDRKSDQLTGKISIIFLLLFTPNLEVNSDLMSKARSAKFLDITFPKVKKSHWLCRENLTWTQKSDFFGLFLQKSDHFWHFWPKKSDYLTLVRLIWPHYLHC